MQTAMTPMLSMYQTQLEASRRFADAVFSGTEKMERVVIDATHQMVTRQLNFAQAMAGAGDPQTAAATMQETLLTRNPSDAVNYQKEFMRVFAEMQNEIGRSLQEYAEQLGANASAALPDGNSGAGSTGEDSVPNPMVSMFSVWESAFKEAAAMAKRNMDAVQSSMTDAARTAADGMSEAASRTVSAGTQAMRAGDGHASTEKRSAAGRRK